MAAPSCAATHHEHVSHLVPGLRELSEAGERVSPLDPRQFTDSGTTLDRTRELDAGPCPGDDVWVLVEQ